MIGWLLLAAALPQDGAQAPAAEAPVATRLPAGTVVELEIVEPVSSRTARPEAFFAIRLAEPVLVDGRVAVPAGVAGQGQVVHAARAGMLGKAGELIIAARRLDCGATPIALRGFRYGRSGASRAGAAIAIPVFGILVKGGDAEVPAGTRANAKLAADVELPAACPINQAGSE